MKRLLVLCLLLIFITGCTSTKNVNKRVAKQQVLSCASSTIDNGVRNKVNIKINYYNNIINSGTIKVQVILPIDSSEEEKEMLNTLSMCSTEVMTNIIEYGKCTSTVEDNKLISVLTIDKDKIKKYNKSIKEIKDEIEKNNNLNCKCTIS